MALLLELKSHIQNQGAVSLTDLSNRFHRPPDTLRGMLQHWVHKGVICHQRQAAPCGGCSVSKTCGSCSVPPETEVYTWVGPVA